LVVPVVDATDEDRSAFLVTSIDATNLDKPIEANVFPVDDDIAVLMDRHGDGQGLMSN
jgi:hypothetical protein